MADGSIAWDIVARDHASEAFKKVSKSADDTNGSLGRFRKATAGVSGAGSPLGALESALGSTATTLGVAGAAIGAVALVANKSVDAYVGLTDSVRQFAERTGASADQASRFVAVTDDYSISAESAQNAIFFLGRALATNEAQLASLGVTANRTASGQLDLVGSVESLADAYARTSDPGKRAELVMTALGRTGRDLIPLLEQGGEGLRSLFATVPGGQILDDNDLQRALDFKLAVDDMHDAFMEIGIELGEAIVPALAAAARAAAPLARGVGQFVSLMALGIKGIVEAVRNPSELANFKDFANKVLEVGDSSESFAATTSAAADSLGDMVDAALKAGPAIIAEKNAVDALHDAHQKVVDAQKDLNDAMTGGGVYADRLADATRNLAAAQRTLEQSQRRVRDLTEDVTDKQAALTEAVFHYGAGSKQAQDAARDLRDTQEDLRDASADVGDAAQRVADAERKQRDARDLTDERREATEKLKRAKDDEEAATYNVAKAEAALKQANLETTGQVVDQRAQVKLLFDAWSSVAGVDLMNSPLGRSLSDIYNLVKPPPPLKPGEAGPLLPGQTREAGPPTPSPPLPSAPPPLKPGEAGPLLPGQTREAGPVAASSTTQVVFNYPVPADQVAAYVESVTRTPY